MRRYEANKKHKRGARGEGPPRFFPDSASLCPDAIDMATAQKLLEEAIEGQDPAHPGARAVYARFAGEFFKGRCHGATADGSIEMFHGYPVAPGRVRFEIPARILKRMMEMGTLSRTEYKRFRGSAR